MPNNNMRELPRYIEERKMIGTMTAKYFFRLLPIWIFLVVTAFNLASPVIVLISALSIFSLFLLFSEVSRNYTVLDLLKDFTRYKKEGNQYYERSAAHEPEYKKVTYVEIIRSDSK